MNVNELLLSGVLSKWHDVISGVSQECILGPVLFVAYINTLPDEIESSNIKLDDNKLFRNIYSDSNAVFTARRYQQDVFLVNKFTALFPSR